MRYQALLYDAPEAQLDLSLFLFDGTPRLSGWSAPPVYSDRLRLVEPDIWSLVGAAVLVMFEATIELLEPHITTAGELLPLHVQGKDDPAFALNVLADINCLDQGATDFGDPSMRRLSFVEHRLPEDGLFKVPEYDTVDIYLLERGRQSGSFRSVIEQRGLTGISLVPVWSTTDGTIPYDLARDV